MQLSISNNFLSKNVEHEFQTTIYHLVTALLIGEKEIFYRRYMRHIQFKLFDWKNNLIQKIKKLL